MIRVDGSVVEHLSVPRGDFPQLVTVGDRVRVQLDTGEVIYHVVRVDDTAVHLVLHGLVEEFREKMRQSPDHNEDGSARPSE